jgi:tetratricopeptide (TPR) repeat protein
MNKQNDIPMVLNREQLIDHLDRTHAGQASVDMDTRIAADPETSQEWKQLRLAVDAVGQAALYEQISTVRASWLSNRTDTGPVVEIKPGVTIVRSISRVALRAAAVILVIGSSAALYKYTVTSSKGMYSAYYSGYDLNTSRGATAAQDDMEEAYKACNWSGVDDAFKKKKVKDNKSYFLEGMADMESKKYDEAIGMFQQVMAANNLSGSDYFEDEAEFYLAMAWLARNDVKEAMPLLDKIKADKTHLYHDVVMKMSSLDLRIAAYKDLK